MSDQLYDAYDDACNRVREQDVEIAALKARIAELEAEKRWIPVTESLPKDRTVVMIASNKSDYVTIAILVSGLWFGDDGNPEPWTDVSHWMPLPAPPLQEQEE
jgi:hypothetical protein